MAGFTKILPGVNKTLNGDSLISHLTEKFTMATTSRSLNDPKVAGLVLSTESLSQEVEQTVATVYNNFESTVRAIAQELNLSLEDYRIEAASIAAMYSADPKRTMSTEPRMPAATGSVHMVRPTTEGGTFSRNLSMEAYDERDNKSAQVHSIVYNMMASKQDEFGEAFFPTIVVNTADAGILLDVRVYQVFNDFKRSTTGTLANKMPKNLVRAYADPTILVNESTRAVPVYRATGGADDNTDKFVAATDVAPYMMPVGNVLVQTSALKVGKRVDIIGLAQTNELLENGILDSTDTLDSFAQLETLYVKFTDPSNPANVDVFAVDTTNIPGSVYTYSVQGNFRKLALSLDTDSIVFAKNMKRVDGSNPVVLTELAANDWDVRFTLNISGDVSMDKGDSVLNKGTMDLNIVRDVNGNIVTPPGTFTAKLATVDIVGYTTKLYFANSNLRQRGQMIESQRFFQAINLKYNSPVVVVKPVTEPEMDEQANLQLLISATNIRTSKSAVKALLDTEASIQKYVAIADMSGQLPDQAGIGRYLVKPVYYTSTVNLSDTVDSLSSHQRLADIRAALIEKIRYYATEMYRNSEYQAGALVYTGNISFKPTVVIGTDPTIYNYLMSDGELRTLGELFEVKVVNTLDTRVRGKIYMTFSVYDANRNTTVNPLSFGNMLWSPELVVKLPISRNGQISKEMMVSPRFMHIVNLPILTVLNVTNLPNVTNKVAVNFHNV